MARVRRVEIYNFKGIQALSWDPSPGINCLIGPGDSGKSTILDAIDLCLGARRSAQFSDADFYGLNVDNPIIIRVTIGELDDALLSIDSYGMFLRGFHHDAGRLVDEPEAGAETVLTICLTVEGDLEPVWTLVSERAKAQNLERNLNWKDRQRLAPNRIGFFADSNLSWRRGSVLNRLSEERADASAVLSQAAREARAAFGGSAQAELTQVLDIVTETGHELGVPVGERAQALLDAQTVSFGGGTISLHDSNGVPLRGLGLGSSRLLIAGMQRKASAHASMVLSDELEYGLEPHRIIRFLASLGAKESPPPLQSFLTTHSPVALRELSGDQLFVVRGGASHEIRSVGTDPAVQGTIRLFPEAFLATAVLVCEGASEVGLVRGLDQYSVNLGGTSIAAHGVALVDGKGSEMYRRALAFQSLGYRTAVLRDDDVKPDQADEASFIGNGGNVFIWRDGRALEQELFASLGEPSVQALIATAVGLKGEGLINANIGSASSGRLDLNACRASITPQSRAALGTAAKRKPGWFKTVGDMEQISLEVVGPGLSASDPAFHTCINSVFQWAANAQR